MKRKCSLPHMLSFVFLALGNWSALEAQATNPEDVASKSAVTEVNNLKQLVLALKLYAADHEGKYPKTLQDLVTEGIITKDGFARITQSPFADPKGSYEYVGAKLTDASLSSEVLIRGLHKTSDGKHAAGFCDGTVKFVKDDEEKN